MASQFSNKHPMLFASVLITSFTLAACGGGSGSSASDSDGTTTGTPSTDDVVEVVDNGSNVEPETETEAEDDVTTPDQGDDTENDHQEDEADQDAEGENVAGGIVILPPESACDVPSYQAGTGYSAGAVVQNSGRTFRCDVAGWCASASAWAYEPGVGSAWQSAWTELNTCYEPPVDAGGDDEGAGDDSNEGTTDQTVDSNDNTESETGNGANRPTVGYEVGIQYAENSGIDFGQLGGAGKSENYRIIGYYMPSLDGSFPPSAIGADQARQLTHINFAFMHINDQYECDFAPGDDPQAVAGIIAELQQLKSHNPDLKILFSIGGWALSNDDSNTVSNYRTAFTSAHRENLANSCVSFMQTYGFDGIDIDWEYPRTQDVDNFIAGLALMRSKLEARGMGELLTIAGAGGAFYLSRYYDKLPAVVEQLDFINLMSYDLNGPWNGVSATNHHAHLYGNASEPKFYNALREANLGLTWEELTARHQSPFALTVDAAVKQHLLMDIPRDKIIMGVPFYGRAFFNVGSGNDGLYQSFNTPKGDPYVGDASLLYGCEPCEARGEPRIATYNEIKSLRSGGWGYEYHFDEGTKAVWLYHPEKNIFVSYDDPSSLRYKTDYIRSEGLGGAMFWHLGQDDAQFTMLGTLHNELNSDAPSHEVIEPDEQEETEHEGGHGTDGADSGNESDADGDTADNTDSESVDSGSDVEPGADDETDAVVDGGSTEGSGNNTDESDSGEVVEVVTPGNSADSDYVVGTYFVEWGVYGRNYHVADMPADKLTHVLYGFIPVCGPNDSLQQANPSGYSVLVQQCAGKPDYSVVVHDKFAALEKSYPGDQWDDPIRGNFGQLIKMKQQHPHIKVLPSVGGWTLSDPFFQLANDAAKRAVFVNSVADFLRAYDFFDGVDIDWEFPGGGGANGALGSAADYQGYADLMRDLRAMLDNLEMELGKELELTSAIGAAPAKVAAANYTEAQMYMDYIFLMSYDYYGAWNTELGHQTALYDSAVNQHDGYYTSAGVDALINAGVESTKIVVGVAMYGRGWSQIQGGSVDDPFTGTGTSSSTWQGEQVNKVTGSWEDGVLDYKDIVNQYLGGTNGTGINGYQYYYDEVAEAPYLWNVNTGSLITYDNPRSTRAKANYVKQHQLGGLFSWEIDADNGDIVEAMESGLAH